MLGPLIFQLFGDLRPLFALVEDVFSDKSIFSSFPLTMFLLGVEVVVPSLAALLATAEILLVGKIKQFACDFVPFVVGGVFLYYSL